jgi:hypothetical protein
MMSWGTRPRTEGDAALARPPTKPRARIPPRSAVLKSGPPVARPTAGVGDGDDADFLLHHDEDHPVGKPPHWCLPGPHALSNAASAGKRLGGLSNAHGRGPDLGYQIFAEPRTIVVPLGGSPKLVLGLGQEAGGIAHRAGRRSRRCVRSLAKTSSASLSSAPGGGMQPIRRSISSAQAASTTSSGSSPSKLTTSSATSRARSAGVRWRARSSSSRVASVTLPPYRARGPSAARHPNIIGPQPKPDPIRARPLGAGLLRPGPRARRSPPAGGWSARQPRPHGSCSATSLATTTKRVAVWQTSRRMVEDLQHIPPGRGREREDTSPGGSWGAWHANPCGASPPKSA